MGCFGFNLIKLRVQQSRKLMTKHGLENRQVKLRNGSSIDCWLPSTPEQSRPALLLVHGFVFNALLEWENQIQVFTRNFNVYIPNLLFFGSSTTESDGRSEVFQAECMKLLLDELDVRQVHALGTSYGGMVVFWMAHLYPRLVDKLVLADAAILMVSSDNDTLVGRCGGRARSVSDVLMPENVQDARRSMEFATQKSTMLLPNCLVDDIIQEVFCHNREQRLELLDGMKIGSPKNAPEIPTLQQAVLILWGQNDKIFPLEMAHGLLKHLGKNSRLDVIPGVAHLPQADDPKAFNHHVLSYLLTT